MRFVKLMGMHPMAQKHQNIEAGNICFIVARIQKVHGGSIMAAQALKFLHDGKVSRIF
jgi:hypothetical protein